MIASGDMSHRLKPGAPAGHHQDAWTFDRDFIAALIGKDWNGIRTIQTQEIAAEDVVESTRVAMAAAGQPLFSEVILPYEGRGVWGMLKPFLPIQTHPYALARMAATDVAMNRRSNIPSGARRHKGSLSPTITRGKLRGYMAISFQFMTP